MLQHSCGENQNTHLMLNIFFFFFFFSSSSSILFLFFSFFFSSSSSSYSSSSSSSSSSSPTSSSYSSPSFSSCSFSSSSSTGNRTFYETVWKNVAEPNRPAAGDIHIIRLMRFASRIPKATNTVGLCDTYILDTQSYKYR